MVDGGAERVREIDPTSQSLSARGVMGGRPTRFELRAFVSYENS